MLFYNVKNICFTENQVQIVNDKSKDKKCTKQNNYQHLIQFIILLHRCTVKVLREEVFMI